MDRRQFIKEVVDTFRKVNDLILDRQWDRAELHLRSALRATSINLSCDHPLHSEIRKRITRLFEAEMAYIEMRN